VLGVDAGCAKRRTRSLVNSLAEDHGVLVGSEGPQGSILKLRPPMPFGPRHADLLTAAIEAAAAKL
jgi:4-aminobutyrate aminotransferase-like enzyme